MASEGDVILKMASKKELKLINVLYVLKIHKNLVSGWLLNKFGFRLVLEFDKFVLSKDQMYVGKGHPTDSTPIQIIDQPSSSSQPKKDKPFKKAQRQKAEVPQDETEHVKVYQHLPMIHNLVAKDAQAKEIAALKKRIHRLERRKKSRPTSLKRLRKVAMSRRVESSEDQESLGAPEDASKQGRSIADIDVDVEVTLVDETQERQDDDLMFDTRVLEDVEMPVEAKVDGKDNQSKKLDDSTAGEAVTTAGIDDTAGDDSVVPTTSE
ncbi:hypothetical protein Tco_0488627 [Tanacetum coccineum]